MCQAWAKLSESLKPVPKQHVIVFGYAGWGAGQLEAEVERRDWYWAPVEESLIFDPDDRGKWKRALKNSGLDL